MHKHVQVSTRDAQTKLRFSLAWQTVTATTSASQSQRSCEGRDNAPSERTPRLESCHVPHCFGLTGSRTCSVRGFHSCAKTLSPHIQNAHELLGYTASRGIFPGGELTYTNCICSKMSEFADAAANIPHSCTHMRAYNGFRGSIIVLRYENVCSVILFQLNFVMT